MHSDNAREEGPPPSSKASTDLLTGLKNGKLQKQEVVVETGIGLEEFMEQQVTYKSN
jgi:hypothetical protein